MTTNKAIGDAPESGAAFRVMGVGLDLDGISQNLGIEPSHVHRSGEVGPLQNPYATDMWMLESPLDSKQPLDEHVKWLRNTLVPHYEYLLSLKQTATIDIYCSQTCFRDQNGLSLSNDALQLFVELRTPLEISLLMGSEFEETEPKSNR